MATRFYETANSDAVQFFRSTATGPEVIADAAFSSVGRVVVRDQGYFAVRARGIGSAPHTPPQHTPPCVAFCQVGLALLFKLIDRNLMANIATRTVGGTADFKKLKAKATDKKHG